MPNSNMMKFSDDTAVNDDESYYSQEIELSVKWSKDNNLILNVDKTKELIIDFRCINSKDLNNNKW